MNDCSPLRLAENGDSSPNQSSGSHDFKRSDQSNNRHIGRRPERRSKRPELEATGSNHQVDEHVERSSRSFSESSSKSGGLRYGAKHVIELFIPVSLCMAIVVATMTAIDNYKYSSQTLIWYSQYMFTDQTVDTGTRVWQSFANAFIMLVFIVIMTTVLILLYKFNCYATIHGWLILSSLVLLFMFALMYIAEFLKFYNIPMDYYTLLIFIWNFGIVGMVSIHWKGPLLLQQGYLITISALMALVFIRSLPDWTTWTVLAIVSVWDLIAVLCPRGPLRLLVEMAQERNEPIFPALIYSSTMLWEYAVLHVVSVTSPMVLSLMAHKDKTDSETNRDRGTRRNRRDRKQNSRNRPQRLSSQVASGSGLAPRPDRNPNDLWVPSRQSQIPIEIHYEQGAQPPEVDIIQPTLSGNSDSWTTPVVCAVDSLEGLQSERNNPIDREATGSSVEATATGITINFQNQNARVDQHLVEEERGVKLGLGDFIFYSLLVGKAASYGDWTVTISCYVAILVGLSLTLSLLAVFRKALPALPISIALGMGAFFMSRIFVVPLTEQLAINQIFI